MLFWRWHSQASGQAGRHPSSSDWHTALTSRQSVFVSVASVQLGNEWCASARLDDHFILWVELLDHLFLKRYKTGQKSWGVCLFTCQLSDQQHVQFLDQFRLCEGKLDQMENTNNISSLHWFHSENRALECKRSLCQMSWAHGSVPGLETPRKSKYSTKSTWIV